jgi:hypothetical protein
VLPEVQSERDTKVLVQFATDRRRDGLDPDAGADISLGGKGGTDASVEIQAQGRRLWRLGRLG